MENDLMKTGKKTRSSLCNPVMFSVVMKDEELFRELLSRILPERKIRALRLCEQEDEVQLAAEALLQTEKNIIVNPFAKSVRFDVLFEEDDAWYNVEMQALDTDVLPQRSRYYHAAAAVDSLKRGQQYRQLKPGYVIFICLFDLFKQDKAVYSFEMYDKKNHLHLNDGQFTMFLNTACRKDDIPDGLRNLFLYLEENTVDESDLWICRLRDAVRDMETKKEVQSKMTLYDEWLITANEVEEMKRVLEAFKEEKERVESECRRAEEERRQAEIECRQAEKECQQAEAERQREELKRQQAEAGRRQAEIECRQAETERRRAEKECQRAEAERQKVETEYHQAEAERQREELKRQQAEAEYQRFQLLSKRLLDQNRMDDLKRALEDADYKDGLFTEYEI